MGAIKHAMRQPIKVLLGIVVVTLAVTALLIGIEQAGVARNTERVLANNFTTVALPTTKYQYETVGMTQIYKRKLPKEIRNWLDQTIANHPEIVKSVQSVGLASAYVPDLVIDNYTNHNYNDPSYAGFTRWFQPWPEGMPYSCAMLEIVLNDIGEVNSWHTARVQWDGTVFDADCVRVILEGTITSVIGLQEGYNDPTGFTARITLVLPDTASFEAMNLQVGEKYLVFGMDYSDTDWEFHEQMKENYGVDQVDPNAIIPLSEAEIEANKAAHPKLYTVAYYEDSGRKIKLSNLFFAKYRAIELTVEDKSLHAEYTTTKLEDGTSLKNYLSIRTYLDEDGTPIDCTLQEYQQRYTVPTIVHIPEGVDALFSSEEGKLWRTALEQIEVNNHAFPIIGVEKLGCVTDFARETARVVEGRDFSEEELKNGEKVCIISQSLTVQNNLGVGDTITLQYYTYDWCSPYQEYITNGRGVCNPSAYFYTSTTKLLEEETYTIVGLYRQDNPWLRDSNNIYSFTPNTIFAPQNSVSGDMDFGNQAFFGAIVLENGTAGLFQQLVADAGYDGLFVYYDQGYSVIANSLSGYEEIADRALKIGIGMFLVLIMLYLLLFPLQQKKNVIILDSIGAPRKTCVGHIVGTSLCILGPATLIGFVLSICCWQLVVESLYSSEIIILSAEMNAGRLLLTASIQFVITTILVTLCALLMTKERKLGKRK